MQARTVVSLACAILVLCGVVSSVRAGRTRTWIVEYTDIATRKSEVFRLNSKESHRKTLRSRFDCLLTEEFADERLRMIECNKIEGDDRVATMTTCGGPPASFSIRNGKLDPTGTIVSLRCEAD